MKKIFSIISDMVFRFPRLRLFLCMVFVFIFFSVITVMLTQSDQVRTDPVGWENYRVYSPAGTECRNVNTDKNGNTLAIVYEGVSRGKKGIYFNVSFDGGGSFMPSKKIAEFTSQINNNPCIAISGSGEIRVAWYVISDDESSGSIFQSVSKDLGATWSQPERLTFGLQMEILPVFKYDNRNVLHLFFTAYRGSRFNLFHATMENGKGFAEPVTVAELSGDVKGAFFPAIKFFNSRVAVVWQAKEKSYEDSLYFAGSDDYGRSWSNSGRITPPGSNYQAPSIAIVDSVIYLVFMNNKEKNWGIKMLRSFDSGESWDEQPLKISETNANCFSPDISQGPDNGLYIIWHDTRDKSNRVYLKTYAVATKELSPETGLSVRKKPGRKAAVLNTGRRIIVFWEEAGSIVGLFSDISVDAPVVRSRTHPVDVWTRETDAVVEWDKPKDESGIAGFATVTDKNPDTSPAIQNLRYDADRAYISGLEDGITYFHIRTVDGAGNMSRTVHYRLQVSSNPLAMPVVISTTHPENGKSLKTDAVFRWAVNDSRRLKGFVYSLSKDVALRPDRFLEKFDIRFDNLENGVYYFNIAAISTTNQVSRVTTYCFIVGTEGDFNTDYMKDLALRDYDFEKKGVARLEPVIEIMLPFGGRDWFDRDSFSALIRTQNIPPERILGYSVVIDNVKKVPPEKINLKEGRLSVKGLFNGNYAIGVRCRYERLSGGRRVAAWSEPAYAFFSIKLGGAWSPFDAIFSTVMKKIREYPVVISMFMLLFTVTVAYIGFGDRIIFFYKLMDYRIRGLF